MLRPLLLLSFFSVITAVCHAQSVGINNATPDASAMLDIKSTSKGLLIPRMGTSGITSIGNPAKGLLVLDTSTNQLMVNMGTPTSPNWQTIVFKSGWGLTGNSNIDTAINFIGTTDFKALRFRVNNFPAGTIDPATNNVGLGLKVLSSNNNGLWNSAVGGNALYFNTDGIENSAFGYSAMYRNTTGNYNTIVGSQSFTNNTTGSKNTAMGYATLLNNNASGNTATGYQSLYSNTTGPENTASGYAALFSNNSGFFNTAAGSHALYYNVDGDQNTANGSYALYKNTSGADNAAFGVSALEENRLGFNNTAVGNFSLRNNQSGNENTAIGAFALDKINNVSGNTSIGYQSGNDNENNYNTMVGAYAHITNANGCTAIGYNASTMNTNNLIVLGSPPIAFTGGYTPWTNFSDGRFKKNIKEEVKGLDFILHLRPVTYHMDIRGLYNFWGTSPYGNGNVKMDDKAVAFVDDAITKKEAITMTGFVAQEVEKAAHECGYNFDGVVPPQNDKDHYRIAYEEFVVPLVKAMQEQQSIIEQQQQKNKTLESEVDLLKQKVEKLAAALDKLTQNK